MSKISGKLHIPSEEEDAVIRKGIAADPDTREVSSAEFKQMKPVRGRGRPAGSGMKEQITLRVDREVIDAFRAGGEGWQTRMNDALREWVSEHPQAAA